MPRTMFASLRDRLTELKDYASLSGLKTGTEVEDMCFEEIRLLRALSDGIIPLYVKIGGPEARNDMRELVSIGVDGLIAPMVESPYGLEKFIESLSAVTGPVAYDRLRKGINMETITAFQNLDAIYTAPEFAELDQITAARSDLSQSMKLSTDDERVIDICGVIVSRARDQGLRTSVGGNIHSGIIERIIHEAAPDTVNTRHMVIHSSAKEPAVILEHHLQFELELYRYLASMPSPRQSAHANRVRVLEGRMNRAAATLV